MPAVVELLIEQFDEFCRAQFPLNQRRSQQRGAEPFPGGIERELSIFE